MPNDINELDEQDIGLQMVMGNRFHDATKEDAVAAETEAPCANTAKVKKVAQKPMSKPREAVNAQWEPVVERSFPQKLIACGKKAAVYAGLCLLFFYWQQTGQMEPSAAMPCMMACTTMVGVTYGRVFAKEMC